MKYRGATWKKYLVVTNVVDLIISHNKALSGLARCRHLLLLQLHSPVTFCNQQFKSGVKTDLLALSRSSLDCSNSRTYLCS